MWFYGYTPILILQGFCLYHAIRNNNEQRWFYLIVFLPLVGSLIYLYYNFAGKVNVNQLTEGVKGAVNSNYVVRKLEKELEFTDSITNRSRLAIAYTDNGRYQEAINLFQSCLEGHNADDTDIMRHLVRAYYLQGNYPAAIGYGKKLEGVKEFINSEERIAYAWALHRENQSESALKEFEAMDSPYSNFPHRLEYAKFLIELDRKSDAVELLKELSQEYNQLEGLEKRLKKSVYQQVRALMQQVLAG